MVYRPTRKGSIKGGQSILLSNLPLPENPRGGKSIVQLLGDPCMMWKDVDIT